MSWQIKGHTVCYVHALRKGKLHNKLVQRLIEIFFEWVKYSERRRSFKCLNRIKIYANSEVHLCI